MGRPEAEKSGLLNCRMSHNFNVSSPNKGWRMEMKNQEVNRAVKTSFKCRVC